MAIDFNNEEQQKERSNGTIPPNSKVLVSLSIEKPNYAHDLNEYIAVSKTGLLGLWVKYTVIAGRYEGSGWHENIWLPEGQQDLGSMDENQRLACRIGGARIRAIIEASRRIHPEDKTPSACRNRQIQDWLDLNGMEFPIRVGLEKEAKQSKKSGVFFWPNKTAAIITRDKPEYDELMNRGEVISDIPIPPVPGASPGRADAPSSPGALDDDPF